MTAPHCPRCGALPEHQRPESVAGTRWEKHREAARAWRAAFKARDPEGYAAYVRAGCARFAAKRKAEDPEGFARYQREAQAKSRAKRRAAHAAAASGA